MGQEHREIIQKIGGLDLKTNPLSAVKEYLRKLGKYGVMVTTFHPGKLIVRARVNEDRSFTSISELSYKPQQFNTTYQRASTPKKTMFYGATVPEALASHEPTTARITAIYEVSEFVRNPNSMGEQEVTYSAWEVTDDITLVSLIHHRSFGRPTKLAQDLQKDYEKQVGERPEYNVSSQEITNYLAAQFAKPQRGHHTDYLISAAYSEMVAERFDGVLYPSVRLQGEGINVAIKPESVKNKLKFIAAVESTIYKNKEAIYIGDNSQSVLLEEGNLVYRKLTDGSYLDKEFGRRQVGLK